MVSSLQTLWLLRLAHDDHGCWVVRLSVRACGCVCADFSLGFNNRVCSVALDEGETAGPVMRNDLESVMWRDWFVRVEDNSTSGQGRVLVSLQAFVPPDKVATAKCPGYLSTFYGSPGYVGTCGMDPYGQAMFLNGTRGESGERGDPSRQSWEVRQVGGRGAEGPASFQLLASKPSACRRAIGVDSRCDRVPELVNERGQGSQVFRWEMVRRYEAVPAPPLPTLPSPPSTPAATPAAAPGPVIRSSTVSPEGLISLFVQSFGGDQGCHVRGVEFQFTPSSGQMGSPPLVLPASPFLHTMGVQHTFPQSGLYFVHAVGKCKDGSSTAKSNTLEVQVDICVRLDRECTVTYDLYEIYSWNPENESYFSDLAQFQSNWFSEGNCCPGSCGSNSFFTYLRSSSTTGTGPSQANINSPLLDRPLKRFRKNLRSRRSENTSLITYTGDCVCAPLNAFCGWGPKDAPVIYYECCGGNLRGLLRILFFRNFPKRVSKKMYVIVRPTNTAVVSTMAVCAVGTYIC